VPGPNDVVSITHAVQFDTAAGEADVIGISAGGSLLFATQQNTRLRVGILMVLPQGRLEVGTPSNPVNAAATAEILIRDRAINTTTDPGQFGTGLIVVDGAITMHGAVKSPTFIRTAQEPRAGHTTLSLEQAAAGWQIGDRVFLPDTRQVPAEHWFNQSWALQFEERQIQNISADGRTLTLSSALNHDHRGARDANGTPTVLSNGIRLLPHVGNLTRNIVIRSENPSGTRGHTMYTNRATVSVSYVQYQDLGRTRPDPLNSVTNRIGRYPVHIHHLWGPPNSSNTGYQFAFVGNAINDSRKWPMAIHGSHFGLVRRNVIYGGSELTGAGIALEDGTETENLLEENLVANIRGHRQPRDSGPSTADGTTPGSAAECVWAAGFNNKFVNNVVTGCRNTVQQIVSGPGFKFIVPPGPYNARNPRFRGADMTDSTQTVSVVPQHQPIREFRANEVYGLAADGFTAWNLGTDGYELQPQSMGETLIKDFRVWHTYEGAIWNYPVNGVMIDGLVYRIDPAATVYWNPAINSGDYRNINLKIRGGSIHAGSVFGGTTDPLGTYTIENVEAVTRGHAFHFDTPATPGTAASRPSSGVTVILRNNRVQAWPGQPLKTIEMNHDLSKANSQPDDKYEVLVYDYQGQAGNNFRAYFGVQASQNLYGGIAPCSDSSSRPEVRGITCPISSSTGLPSRPTNLRITVPEQVQQQ
jgi:hypothetical protein